MSEERRLLAWAYSKLHARTFADQADALALDEIKLLLMQDDADDACGVCGGRGAVGNILTATTCPACDGTGQACRLALAEPDRIDPTLARLASLVQGELWHCHHCGTRSVTMDHTGPFICPKCGSDDTSEA